MKFISFTTFLYLFLFSVSSLPAQTKEIVNIDYCSLFNKTKAYEGQIVRTRALMTYSTVPRVDGGDSFFYSPKCNNGDNFAIPRLAFTTFRKNPSNFFDKLPVGKDYIFEIEFIGKLQTLLIPAFGHLGWSRAQVEVIELRSLRNVTPYARQPNHKAGTPIIDLGKQLRFISDEIMSYLAVTGDNLSKLSGYLSDDLKIIGVSGKTLNKTNLAKIKAEDLFGKLGTVNLNSIYPNDTTQEGNHVIISGIIDFELDNKITEKFRYTNFFQTTKDNAVLTEIRITKFPNAIN